MERGPELTELIARRPPSVADACRLLEPLAAAVGQAHHRGLVLGVWNPLRLRGTLGGRVRLAFPGPPARVRPPDDVRGLGAILYLLLTGRWPTGLPTATPRELRPEVPDELSEVAMRSLENTRTGGIRTSDTILQVLRQVSEEADRTVTLPAVPPDPDGDRAVWTTKPACSPRTLAQAVARAPW